MNSSRNKYSKIEQIRHDRMEKIREVVVREVGEALWDRIVEVRREERGIGAIVRSRVDRYWMNFMRS